MERHMDRIAQVVGISPNRSPSSEFPKAGKTTTTEQPFAKILTCIICSTARWNFLTTPRRKSASRRKQNCDAQKGIGIAAFLHGAGSPAPANAI